MITTVKSNLLLYVAILVNLWACACIGQVAVPEVPPQAIFTAVLGGPVENLDDCQQTCASLASQLPDAIFVGQTGRFDFWDAKQAEIIPACRVEPSSSTEVARVLREILAQQCHFAIKSGGHERTVGSSNVEGGIVLDLVRLKDLEVSEDKQSVRLGAGLRWEEVYRNLEQQQLMVLGGRVSDVGIGGLLLGGGISFFSNERGLACDSIISYEIVLPNSTIATVSRLSQPQLYRALRGAGAANFGIVTSFEVETFTHNQPDGIWSGNKLFPWEDIDQLLQANHQVTTKAMDVDPGIAIMNMFVCHPKHKLCYGVVQAQHTQHTSVKAWPKLLSAYGDIKGLPQTTHMQMAAVSNTTEMFAGSSPSGRYRTIYGAFTYLPSVALERDIAQIFREEVDSVHDMFGFLPGVIMHPFSRNMIAQMRKNGANAMRSLYTHKSGGPFIILNVSWQWREKIDDNRAYQAYYRLMHRMEEAAKRLNVWHPYKYVNYAEATQDVWSSYGEDVMIELKELQQQLDPEGIFTREGLMSGFFKINTSKDHTSRDKEQPSADRDRSEL